MRAARYNRRLAELGAGGEIGDFGLAVHSPNINLNLPINDIVENVAAPFTLTDDLLSGGIGEQPHVGADLLTVVISAVDDDFEVNLVIVATFMSGGEVSDGLDALQGLEHFRMLRRFLRHNFPLH